MGVVVDNKSPSARLWLGTLVNPDAFYAAMKKIGRLNMSAAASVFVSALCQAIALYLSFH